MNNLMVAGSIPDERKFFCSPKIGQNAYAWRDAATFALRGDDAVDCGLITQRRGIELEREHRDYFCSWDEMYRSHWFQTLVYQLENVNADVAGVLCDEVLKNMCIMEFN